MFSWWSCHQTAVNSCKPNNSAQFFHRSLDVHINSIPCTIPAILRWETSHLISAWYTSRSRIQHFIYYAGPINDWNWRQTVRKLVFDGVPGMNIISHHNSLINRYAWSEWQSRCTSGLLLLSASTRGTSSRIHNDTVSGFLIGSVGLRALQSQREWSFIAALLVTDWLTAFFRSMARTDPMRRVTSHSMFTLSEKVITDSILLLSRHSIIPPWIDLDPLEDAPPVNNYTPRERQEEEEEEELLILRQSSLCALNGLFARLVDPNQSENFG